MKDMQGNACISGYNIIDKIKEQVRKADGGVTAEGFRMPELAPVEKAMQGMANEAHEPADPEWRNYHRAVLVENGKATVTALPEDVRRYKEYLRKLEQAYLADHIPKREESLEYLVYLGQEVLRRRYFAMLMNPGIPTELTESATLIIETGASAIQTLGRAPAGPRYPYRTFKDRRRPSPDDLGVEILSSGAFPDWTDPALKALRDEGKIGRMGFENVIDACLDTPRSRVLARAIREGKNIGHLDFPLYNRTMLDLELMRLGQATTPGTYSMLLDSFYYGALFVDHSTNISEQVQIIYAEEEWHPAWVINLHDDMERQALEAAASLVKNYFRFAAESPVGQDHPRTARIQFSSDMEPELVTTFLKQLKQELKTGPRQGRRRLPSPARVHQILPALFLEPAADRLASVKTAIVAVRRARYRSLALMSEMVRNRPGLPQFFYTDRNAERVAQFGRSKRIRLINGRTIDMIATVNKATEAAVGAIAAGQGCIKVGLLGLTFEEMKEFIRGVKRGMRYHLRRDQNRRLVFIGIVDEPLVRDEKTETDGYRISRTFLDLMRITSHNILLLDTMHKDETDRRLVDAGDSKGGHLTRDQMRELVTVARKQGRHGCDLWVAGSYTEELVYQTAMDPPEQRPSLICLGGAERSLCGIRLEPRDAYSPSSKDMNNKRNSALVNYHGDITRFLSAENKLARDAGHVVGVLKRRGRARDATAIDKLRLEYLSKRQACLNWVSDGEKMNPEVLMNIDSLLMDQVSSPSFQNKNYPELKKRIKLFSNARQRYLNYVTDHLYQCVE